MGRHFSVTRALPRVLELLAELELRATFFVEGLNADLYPDELRAIATAGHEIGYHGWRHEAWSTLPPGQEAELLGRGVRALDGLGLRPVGFRPPGGELTPSSLSALAKEGFTYCSPAGEQPGVRDGLAVLPFQWPLIDAFHYLPHFASRRRAAVGAPDVQSPASFRAHAEAALRDVTAQEGFLALLFHPFLTDTAERLAAMREILRGVRALADRGAVRPALMRDIAASIRNRRAPA